MKMKKGFTLVELLLVVAILAVLAGVVVPRVLDYRANARIARCAANISNLERAVELYRFTEEDIPDAIGDIQNTTYFPHGNPDCPLEGTYSISDSNTGTIACDHS